MSGSSPLLQAARLGERKKRERGRLGGVKVVIMPNRDYVTGVAYRA